MIADLRPYRLARRPAGLAREGETRGTHRELSELPTRLGKRITALALLLATPAAAQQIPPVAPSPYARAIAAGYKAAMYCSGIFTAGRTPAQIDADEMAGIYPDYDPIAPTLRAEVNRPLHSVTVAWSDTLPPRRAEWRAGRGCVTYPLGYDDLNITVYERPLPDRFVPNPRPWPLGDAGIAPRPSAALAAKVAAAFDRATYGAGKTTGILILRDGRVVAERYGDGWGPFVPNRTWSVAKSITGTLAGLGSVHPKQRADIPEWRTPGDPRAALTIDNLLRMASGLHSGAAGNRTDAIYFGGASVTEEATPWPLEVRPGTRFRYANNDILLAVRSLRATLGEERYRALPGTLFAPLGMTHTTAEQDWQGNYILSSQVWSTARDLARLGQFWLQDGVWQGKRLLPEGWMKYMATPSGPQPADGPGYGATLWLFGPKQGLPAGSYAAQGNRGQYVMVVPSERLVVVRRGEDPGAARFDIARFTADVIAARR